MLTSYLGIKSATRLLLAATLLTTVSFAQGPPPQGPGPQGPDQGPNDQIPPPDPSQQSPDQPGRGVARLSLLQGDVTLKRGDSGEWIAAAPNAPLVVQDRVISGNASKAEVQLDYANFIRLAQNTEVRFAELEYGRYVVQIASGTVTFRVLRNSDADVEVSTPNVAVRPSKRGIYRIAVQPDGSTEITIRNGEAEIYTTNGSEKLKSGRTMLVRGNTTDPEFQLIGAIPRDDWDTWNEQRDKTLEQSQSYKYVSQSVPGAEDLDANGTWSYDAPYGYVWQPTTVSPGWAPYRYGRWSWVDYYGWSWVSYDPWGWAPFHYGRWYMGPRGWCWWPGGMGGRQYWSPGLVGWFGGGGVSAGVGFGHVGWVPLAPHEAYRPWYGWNSYRGYGNRNYNNTNVTVVNNVNITNVYRNARVNNGVTAVSGTDFASGRFNNVVKLSDNEMHRANLVNGRLPFTPDRNSQKLSDRAVAAAPRSNDSAKFYSRRTPAYAERVSFDDQRRGVEESAKRTFGSRNETGGGGAGNVLAPGGSNARGAFDRRSTDAGAAGATTNNGSGWRKAGEATITDPSATSTRGRNSVGTVTGNENRSNSTNTNTDNGWRRFGQPRNEGDVTNSRSGRSSSQNTDSNSNSNRRFGEPGADSNSRRSRTQDSNSNANSNPNSNMDAGRARSNDTFRRSDNNNNNNNGGGGGGSRARESFPSAPRQEAPRHEAPRMERSAPPPQSAPPARSESPRESPRKNNFIGSNERAPRTEGRSSGFANSAPRGDSGSARSTNSGGGGSARSSGSGGSNGGGGRSGGGGGSSSSHSGGGGNSSRGGGGGGGRH